MKVVLRNCLFIGLITLALAACDSSDGPPLPPPGPDVASDWTIGPVIDGRNHSGGLPLHPATCGALLCIEFPGGAQAHAHYVTRPTGALDGMAGIIMRYRVEFDPGVRFAPKTDPNGPSMITLYFQRRGDDWSGKGRFETYRWYADFAKQMPIEAGEHEMLAPFASRWTAVETSDNIDHAAAFRDALANADQIGFVLGGGDGLGHGVFATGKARIVVEEFRVVAQ